MMGYTNWLTQYMLLQVGLPFTFQYFLRLGKSRENPRLSRRREKHKS